MSDKDLKRLKNVIIISEIFLLVVLAAAFVLIRGCALGPDKENNRTSCTEGEVKEGVCHDGGTGRVLLICKEGGFIESFNDCKAGTCSETVFDRDVKPVISAECVSCHTGYDGYDVAKEKIGDFIARTSLPPADPQHMPKNGTSLKDEEKARLVKWRDDGLFAACPDEGAGNNPLIRLDYVEAAILSDLNSLNSQEQLDARYLISSNKSNEKVTAGVLKQFKASADKTINNLSQVREIILSEEVDEFATVYRFSLRDLKLSAADWKLVENADPINFESFTNVGVLLKQITKTRKPWLHQESMAFTAMQATVYYAIRKLPATLNELLFQVGVDVNGDLLSFEALHIGLDNSSRISLNKNRLITRFVGRDGPFYFTSDILQGSNQANNNLFKAPLLKSASGKTNFLFDGSESFFTLPNGLMGEFLSNGQGQRVAEGPISLVSDFLTPFSPVVKIGSCGRCHAAGYLPATDQIKAAVLENGAQFDQRDLELVEGLYRDPKPYFDGDNASYAVALAKMGILASEPDPVNVASDSLRAGKDAEQLAALLFLTKDELIESINRSAVLSATIGQLATGGSISFEQLKVSMADILKETGINQNQN